MTYEQLKHLKPSIFKRKCGVRCETFEQMVELLRPYLDRTGKRGGQCKLNVEDQLLLVLEYWREYRTQFHIATSWGPTRVSSVSADSEGGNAVDEVRQVSSTWKKTASPKFLYLERAGNRCHRKSN